VARYLETALLREYLGFHAYQLRSSIFERLLEPQLVLADDPSLARRLQANPSSLGPDELLMLARRAHTQNNQHSIRSIFDETNDRLRVGVSGYNEERESLLAYLPSIAALCEQIAPQRIVEFSRRV